MFIFENVDSSLEFFYFSFYHFLSYFQFVPFREFIGGQYSNNMQVSQAYLAKEVLAEIPEQFLSYMKSHGIEPKPLSEN